MRRTKLSMFILCLLVAFAFNEANAVLPSSKSKTGTYQAKSLLYMRSDETSCSIWKLELASGKNKVIYTAKDREASCPLRIDLNRKGHLLLVYKDGLQEISLSPSIRKGPLIKFPKPKVKSKNSPAEFWKAAYDDKGAITLWMMSYYPWDDYDVIVHKYKSKRWVRTDTIRCHRFCDFNSIWKRPRNAYFFGEETAAWHEKQKNNPFLVNRKSTYSETELTFKFGNKKTILTINTERGGAHVERTITKDAFLRVGNQKKKTLILSQGRDIHCSETELMGKYLIAYQCSKKRRYDLYDLETGTSIPLHKYTWVYH